MKMFLLTLVLVATATLANAQGTIQFPRLRIEYCLAPPVPAPAPGDLSSTGPGTVIAGPNAVIVMCVPEPSTIALALLGLGGLLLLRRQRNES